jgi:hypothetical protein
VFIKLENGQNVINRKHQPNHGVKSLSEKNMGLRENEYLHIWSWVIRTRSGWVQTDKKCSVDSLSLAAHSAASAALRRQRCVMRRRAAPRRRAAQIMSGSAAARSSLGQSPGVPCEAMGGGPNRIGQGRVMEVRRHAGQRGVSACAGRAAAMGVGGVGLRGVRRQWGEKGFFLGCEGRVWLSGLIHVVA